MKNKIFFAVFFILGFFSSFLYFQNRTQTAPEKTCVEKKTVSESDIRLYAQKLKLLDDLTPTKVYFTYKINPISADTERIDIFLLGGKNMAVDGADLRLIFDTPIQVLDLKQGESFPLYPRLLSTDNSILITGTASIGKDSIHFGRVNEVFASITLKKTPKSSIRLDQENTKVFLLGNPVLDLKNTFETIPL